MGRNFYCPGSHRRDQEATDGSPTDQAKVIATS
jgi:hypothetical protein